MQSSVKSRIGSREVYIRALQDNSIQLVPEYTGNLLLNFDKNATATTRQEVEAALPKALPSDLKTGKVSQAADQDVYVVTKEFSAKNNLTSLADLAKYSQNMVLGGPSELATRAYGPQGLKQIYGATLKQFKPYDSPAVKTKDLLDGKIQLGEYFTTESAIADNGFVETRRPTVDDPAAEHPAADAGRRGRQSSGQRGAGPRAGGFDDQGPDRPEQAGRRRPDGPRSGGEAVAAVQGSGLTLARWDLEPI